jgi:hypothetical protein
MWSDIAGLPGPTRFDAMIGEGSYAILTDGVDAQAASEVE